MSSISVDAITDINGGNTTSINGTTPNAYNTVGKNLFINGSMSIDQRNGGSAVTGITAGGSKFITDRFKIVNETDGQVTGQQSTTTPAGFKNSLYTTVTTVDSSLGSTQYAQISQRIEGNNLSHLDWGTSDAKTVTISFWVRSSLTGDYGVGVYNYNGSYCYFSDVTINTADTWEKKTVTIEGPTSGTWYTDNLLGLEFHISLGTGSSYQGTADAWTTSSFIVASSNQADWIGTSGATFYLTGVQLEVGESATEFEHRPYTIELQLCQRYYENTYPAGSAVGSVTWGPINFRAMPSGATDYACFSYAVVKRAIPTLTAYNGNTGASGSWRGSSGNNRTITLNATESTWGFYATGWSLGDFVQRGHFTADAEL